MEKAIGSPVNTLVSNAMYCLFPMNFVHSSILFYSTCICQSLFIWQSAIKYTNAGMQNETCNWQIYPATICCLSNPNLWLLFFSNFSNAPYMNLEEVCVSIARLDSTALLSPPIPPEAYIHAVLVSVHYSGVGAGLEGLKYTLAVLTQLLRTQRSQPLN